MHQIVHRHPEEPGDPHQLIHPGQPPLEIITDGHMAQVHSPAQLGRRQAPVRQQPLQAQAEFVCRIFFHPKCNKSYVTNNNKLLHVNTISRPVNRASRDR